MSNALPRVPVVWLLQEPRGKLVNFGTAADYGAIKPVLRADENPSLAPGPAIASVMRVLSDYREGDYLLTVPADPMTPFLVGMALAAHGFTGKPIQWLRWDRRVDRTKPGFYQPVMINAARMDKWMPDADAGR